jgi:hypothetical protein
MAVHTKRKVESKSDLRRSLILQLLLLEEKERYYSTHLSFLPSTSAVNTVEPFHIAEMLNYCR